MQSMDAKGTQRSRWEILLVEGDYRACRPSNCSSKNVSNPFIERHAGQRLVWLNPYRVGSASKKATANDVVAIEVHGNPIWIVPR